MNKFISLNYSNNIIYMKKGYIFYATNDIYGMAAIKVIRQIKNFKPSEDIDFILLYINLSRDILNAIEQLDVYTYEQIKLDFLDNNYYKDCLIKLNIFKFFNYDILLYMDVDGLPISSMEELFSYNFDENIACPLCWWGKDSKYGNFVTTALMLVKPSINIWNRIKSYFSRKKLNSDKRYCREIYDMDIINIEFLYNMT